VLLCWWSAAFSIFVKKTTYPAAYFQQGLAILLHPNKALEFPAFSCSIDDRLSSKEIFAKVDASRLFKM
jgi:hypothetical protein